MCGPKHMGHPVHELKSISVFYQLHSAGPKQLCALAHLGYTREAGAS